MASLQVNVFTLKYIQDKVEFWFSEENLVDDEYLNSLMDREEFVLISEIAKFHSVSWIAIEILIDVMRFSDKLEVDAECKRVRAKAGLPAPPLMSRLPDPPVMSSLPAPPLMS